MTTKKPFRSYRVLMIAPTSFFADYGCHVRILEEIRILQAMGHPVTLVTYRNGNDVLGLDIRRTLPIPWRQHYEVGSSRHKIAFDALLSLKSLEVFMRGHYDIIHAHLHEGALVGHVLSRLFDVPLVFDFQGSLTEEMVDHHFLRRDSRCFGLFQRLESWLNRTADAVLTSTSNAERLLVEKYGCDPERVQTLPDCVNADVFRLTSTYPAEELGHLRHTLGIPPGRRLIVYLGLLADHQGTPHLLQALQYILQKRQDVHLLLMGFPGVAFYQDKARALGVDDFVTFTGRIPYEQAPRYLALGDVAAAPKLSKTEGAGKLLNYMAVGLPTVAFRTAVANEYLGMDCLLAEPGNANSLAEKLQEMLVPEESGLNVDVIGEYLHKRSLRLFSWEKAGHKIVSLYDKLVPSPAIPQSRWDDTRWRHFIARRYKRRPKDMSDCTAETISVEEPVTPVASD